METKKIKEITIPIENYTGINQNSSLYNAIHQIIVFQLLSALVRGESNVVGMICLPDLYCKVGLNFIVIA